MSITAIVPLKALDRVKQRLAPRVTATTRRALMRTLFTHVVTTCRATPGIADVVAVVGDAEGAVLAEGAGAHSLREPAAGLNAAVRHATATLSGGASLVVVADLPRLTADDLTRVIAAAGRRDGVVVARARDGGTGALLRRPPAVIAPAFGSGSAAAHLAAAQRADVRATLVCTPGLADDVDRPADLAAQQAAAPLRGIL